MNIQTPASRNTDSESSHVAEEKITKSGKRQAQIDEILAYVTLNQGHTSGEIAAGLGGEYDNVKVSRRLSDMKGLLLEQGDRRKCLEKDSLMVTWWTKAEYRCLGQWNAYVEAGETKEQCTARLQEVPEQMRAQVKAHVQTVKQIQHKAKMEKMRNE